LLLGEQTGECNILVPVLGLRSPVPLEVEEGGHRCFAPVTPFLDLRLLLLWVVVLAERAM